MHFIIAEPLFFQHPVFFQHPATFFKWEYDSSEKFDEHPAAGGPGA
jgi:hypothetical protein